MIDINKFLEQMNKKSNIEINETYLMREIEEAEVYIKKLKNKILKEISSKSKEYKEAEVKEALSLEKVNNESLKERLKQTGENVYELLITLKMIDGRRKSLQNVKDNIKDGYIKPKYTLNSANMVTMAQPALNFLSEGCIKKIAGFEYSIIFGKLEEIYEFLKKYNKIITKVAHQSSFIIKGLTLYTTFNLFMPDSVLGAYEDLYKVKYSDEFREMKSPTERAIYYNSTIRHIVNNKNHGCFKEVWEEYKYRLSQSAELIKSGYMEFPISYNGIITPDDCPYEGQPYENTRYKMIKENIDTRRYYENELYVAMFEFEEYKTYKDKVDLNKKDTIELNEIIKKFRELEPTLESEINRYNEIAKEDTRRCNDMDKKIEGIKD
ncbi:hypothetical protein G9F71_000755 [Clostridium sp. FP2]|uniref:hypothetical protein n=1 Tax=Clostridium sp. FP2 TaxID=2724481 RepID=UPI0013E98575|nr:hypothetical protein [Clostridium sp. FP2]MBZ9621421.1 hypothetical protein [Clostridium sp. FP2]